MMAIAADSLQQYLEILRSLISFLPSEASFAAWLASGGEIGRDQLRDLGTSRHKKGVTFAPLEFE